MSPGGARAAFRCRDAIDFGKNRAMGVVAEFMQRTRRPATRPGPRLPMRSTAQRGLATWGLAMCGPAAWRGLAIILVLTMGSACARADSDATAAEYRIKAAFLLKFLDFVEWPSTAIDRPDAPFLIGVLGSKNLGDALDQAATGRRVNGHPVHVRTLGHDEAAIGLQLLFVGHAETGRVAAIATATEGQSLLLVAESEPALAQGATINFVVIDDKVRFDVSLRAAERAGLKISARLLAVARTVLPSTP